MCGLRCRVNLYFYYFFNSISYFYVLFSCHLAVIIEVKVFSSGLCNDAHTVNVGKDHTEEGFFRLLIFIKTTSTPLDRYVTYYTLYQLRYVYLLPNLSEHESFLWVMQENVNDRSLRNIQSLCPRWCQYSLHPLHKVKGAASLPTHNKHFSTARACKWWNQHVQA